MMRQTIFENRKRQTSFLAFVFVLNHLQQVIVYWLQRKLQIFNGDSRLQSRLVFTKATVLDVEVKIIFFLQFLEDIPIGFFIKVVATVENFKTHSLIF